MFAMGDRVVYPLHGGAIIKDIEAYTGWRDCEVLHFTNAF